MKAKDLLSDAGQLSHKLRTEKDLIRHIGTREDGSSNYSLLLGAGASVTSGIKSAENLIDLWLAELYERFQMKESSDLKSIKEYFEKCHSAWYNPIHPYSSLFEKKYDLPSQRRRFVEQEVDGKLPSIGYAYLTSLVDQNYFNTIFTTNFDDLLSESFYQFSNRRPIICAHDSSVHSISITSKRPKIVKLHGDYLFDDIKSTVKETESLEQNTKDKLVEFCKDYGLIVIGYSGADRSVMDVLDFLCKQEFYLKNGIYWCLREDDVISLPLRNLLWKDKVYPVLIKGFDEFMAKTFHILANRRLDIESNIKHSKLQKTVKSILGDSFKLSSTSDVIAAELVEIKNSRDRHDVSDLLKNVSKGDDSSGLSMADTRNLLEIDSFIEKENFDEAYTACEEYLNSTQAPNARLTYMRTMVRICAEREDMVNAIRWADRLISEDPFRPSLYLLKASYLGKSQSQYEYLKEVKKKFKYSFSILNSLVRYGCSYQKSTARCKLDFHELMSYLEESLHLDPSLDNSAWWQKYRLLMDRDEWGGDDKDVEAAKVQISELIAKVQDINPIHAQTLRIKSNYFPTIESVDQLLEHMKEMVELRESSSIEKRAVIDGMIAEMTHRCVGKQSNELHSIFSRFFDDFHGLETERTPVDILIAKSRYLISKRKEISKARDCLDMAIEKEECYEEIERVIDLAKAFDSFDVSKLDKFRKIMKRNLSKHSYFQLESELSALRGDLREAIIRLDEALNQGMPITTYLVSKSYLLLRIGDYAAVADLCDRYRDEVDLRQHEELLINLHFSYFKMQSKKFDKLLVTNLSAQSKCKGVKACALSILGQEQRAVNLYREVIAEDYLDYFRWRFWPALSSSVKEKVDFGGIEQREVQETNFPQARH
jgi:tetratricopeptide (TPR) repeat protein